MQLLRREHGEALAQVETHLAAEDAARAGAGAVAPVDAVVEDVLHEIEILAHESVRAAAVIGVMGGRDANDKAGRQADGLWKTGVVWMTAMTTG